VTIDWQQVQVEVAGRVVLREGLLELFACSPHTREHESVVAIEARPLHVFQALGLIGLEPGRPVTYDPESSGWLPAAGQPVVIDVRYASDGREQTVSAWDWMKDARNEAPLTPREWVFCGSRVFPGDVFGADVEGTVACVVDFDTALMALPELHSADNSLLWVAARTGQIPADGTACTLLIRAGDREAICVACDDRGRFRLEGRWLDSPGLAGVLRSRLAAEPDLNVRVGLLPGADPAVGRRAVAAIRELGVRHVRLTGATPELTSQPTLPPASSAPPG
jgi:hypothetical protein